MSEKEFKKDVGDLYRHSTYNEDIDRAKSARNTQKNDTNPYIQKEGYLGMDDIDKMRRRKVR
jgi:hypothetical protein